LIYNHVKTFQTIEMVILFLNANVLVPDVDFEIDEISFGPFFVVGFKFRLESVCEPLHVEEASTDEDVTEHGGALEDGRAFDGLEYTLDQVVLLRGLLEQLLGQHELVPVEVEYTPVGQCVLLREVFGDQPDFPRDLHVGCDLKLVVQQVVDRVQVVHLVQEDAAVHLEVDHVAFELAAAHAVALDSGVLDVAVV